MKYIDSGEGKIPLLSVIAILAISLTVNLPGLAISPVLGKLHSVFPHVTRLEIQLLNVLPNLVTIPFILGSGKICTQKNQLTVLTVGLLIYTATGVAYFFAKSMTVLIILSCLLGVGCGLVIPLAASLISQNFSGRPRSTVLGTKSGLSNFMVIVATLFVGWVAAANWHYSFIVYFVPLIPLCLVPFMRSKYINQGRSVPSVALQATDAKKSQSFHFQGKKARNMMWGAMIIYFVATYATMAISYYLPFTMESYGFDTGKVGVATAMYYLSATIAGFGLAKMLKATGVWTMQIGLVLVTIGLFAIGLIHTYACYIIGIFIMGLGYGFVQPILYDKTSYFAPNDAKSTEYFAFLLTCNYVGISSVPFIVEFFGFFIKGSHDPSFSYILNGFISLVLTIVCFVMHKSFVVQAGVIPEEGGLVEEPSSALDPGDRIMATDLTTEDVHEFKEPSIKAVPKDVKKNAPIEDAPENTVSVAQVIKEAEASLAQAKESVAAIRQQQADMLKQEAADLTEKSEVLKKEAQELIAEADVLENLNTDKAEAPDASNSGSDLSASKDNPA
ncbi:MAG: MFS transporter [Muribaculaceae bacterium]|nr:MFS transporter [Muribaculaceae bacterium]